MACYGIRPSFTGGGRLGPRPARAASLGGAAPQGRPSVAVAAAGGFAAAAGAAVGAGLVYYTATEKQRARNVAAIEAEVRLLSGRLRARRLVAEAVEMEEHAARKMWYFQAHMDAWSDTAGWWDRYVADYDSYGPKRRAREARRKSNTRRWLEGGLLTGLEQLASSALPGAAGLVKSLALKPILAAAQDWASKRGFGFGAGGGAAA